MITLTPSGNIPNCYSLNWSAQQSHILEGLKNLVGQDDLLLTDVTLACDGEYVQAHKLVLSLCSSFFKDLFQKNRADKSNTIVILGNVSARNLRYLLQFMYHGRVDIPSKDVDSFLQAGNVLKIEGLIGNASDNDQQQDMSGSGSHFPLQNHSSSVNAPGPSYSVPSTSTTTRSSSRAYAPPGPASSKKVAPATATSSSEKITIHVSKKRRLSEQSTNSNSTPVNVSAPGPSSSGLDVDQSQSSVDPLDLDGTGGMGFHPGEMAEEIDESLVFNDVKSEPIPIFTGYEVSGNSQMMEDEGGADDESYDESAGEDSYGLPPEGNSSVSVTPSAPVSVSAPGPSTSSQAGGGRPRGSMPGKPGFKNGRRKAFKSSLVCCYCSKVCTTNSRLQNHLRTHTKQRPFACDICGKRFSVLQNMKRHARNIHAKV